MAIKAPQPATDQPNPYQPPGGQLLTMEEFEGINTSTTRPGVSDKQCYWIDGFFSIAPRNLRTFPGIGSAIYTAGVPGTVRFYGFFNISGVAYMAVVLSDGSVRQVNLTSLVVTTILPAATINNPVITNVGLRQYGRQYLIIVANQTNGYWLWDGTATYTAGSLAPQVVLTNVGAGYHSPPLVTASGGTGGGATFVATIAGGIVTNVIETNPGSGYSANDVVILNFSGGNSAGSGAVLTANMTGGVAGSGATFSVTLVKQNPVTPGGPYVISSITVTNGGSNYSQFTTVSFAPSGATFQGAVLSPVLSGGSFVGVTIVNPGLYDLNTGTVSASDSGAFSVASVTINNGGSGYSGSAVAVVSGGGSPISEAAIRLGFTAGVVTSATVTSGGVYGSGTPPVITVTDNVQNAAGFVTLMPFGVQGTAAEIYSGRVWVINGPLVQFTAPGSVSNFATSGGGGNFTSNDSFLVVGFTQVLNINGFLYLVADSSVNYISNVQVSGSPPTTTFSNQNADPEVGTPYPLAATAYGQGLILANPWGVHVGYGSSFTKISEGLDGVWATVANFGGNQLSAARAVVYNKKLWMVLATIVDPVSGSTVNKIFLFDGKKWVATMQDVALTFIAGQEINSIITAYGTDGTSIYKLFQQPSTAFTKTVQSKLWDQPGYQWVKAPSRFWSMWQVNNAGSPALKVSIDNETNSLPYTVPSSTYTVTPSGAGYFVWPPQAVGQAGFLAGMTIRTNIADASLISARIGEEVEQYRG